MNSCIHTLNAQPATPVGARVVAWLQCQWLGLRADRDRARVSASLATLDDCLLADIGMKDTEFQRRILGTDLATVRRQSQWRRSAMDFRQMPR